MALVAAILAIGPAAGASGATFVSYSTTPSVPAVRVTSEPGSAEVLEGGIARNAGPDFCTIGCARITGIDLRPVAPCTGTQTTVLCPPPFELSIDAGDLDDVVTGGPGFAATFVNLGSGNDRFSGEAFDVTGGEGNDTVGYPAAPAARVGFPENEGQIPVNVGGGAGADILFGRSVSGGSGDDLLEGATLYGESGDDRLTAVSIPHPILGVQGSALAGGPGDDVIRGTNLRQKGDSLFGEGGRDRLLGGAGPDKLNGGPEADRCDGQAPVDRNPKRADTARQCEKVVSALSASRSAGERAAGL